MELSTNDEAGRVDCICDIATAIANVKQVTPTRLTPLYETVDPELIDAVVRSPNATSELSFEYEGCEVVVSPEGFRIVRDGEVLEEHAW